MLAVFPLSSVAVPHAACTCGRITTPAQPNNKGELRTGALVCSGPVHVFARSLSRSLPPAALLCLVPELIVPPEPLASIALDFLLQLKRKGRN